MAAGVISCPLNGRDANAPVSPSKPIKPAPHPTHPLATMPGMMLARFLTPEPNDWN